MNVAMSELRDVMVQYASCADPTESAARKERLRLAEEEGQFEETAEQMVRSNLQAPLVVVPSQVSPSASVSQERIPVALRLGPNNIPPRPSKPKKRVTGKKRLGRPPSKPQARKAPLASPHLAATSRVKKRKLLCSRPSPRRRLNMDPLLVGANAANEVSPTRDLHVTEGTSPPLRLTQGQASRSSSSGLMDFRNPSKLLP